MVGLGTQDSLEEAEQFVQRYGATFKMLWDPTFQSWRALGITGQPAAILLDRNGEIIERWFGIFDEAEVLELASAA